MGTEPVWTLERYFIAALLYAALVAFAIAYNRWVAGQQARNGGIYTAQYVAFGTSVTLVAPSLLVLLFGFAGITAAFLYWLAFACSGLPMLIGAERRHTASVAARNARAIGAAQGAIDDAAQD